MSRNRTRTNAGERGCKILVRVHLRSSASYYQSSNTEFLTTHLNQSTIYNLQSTIPVVLASTQHDPEGRLYDQTARVLPQLTRIFGGIAIQATRASQPRSLD